MPSIVAQEQCAIYTSPFSSRTLSFDHSTMPTISDHRDPDGMLLASAMANQIVSPLLIFSMKAHWRVGTFFHLPSWSVEVQVRPRLADDEECSMINDVAIVSQIVTLSGKPVASLLHSNDVDASLNAISTVHPNANRSNAQTQTRAFHRSTSASSASSASQYVY